MSLIQRQEALVAQLEPLHARFMQCGHGAGGAYAGSRSRLKRKHIDALVAAGYSKREAAESAQQCDDVAYRNADHALVMAQMGAGQEGGAA